ncbi:hypothetical protein BFP72_17790 [Reichenbachiella sp. 5M10]|uniref:DUF2061 domain-containing protein n=1 Tax=Reichenbachiella sp. 5M10 TaxID=1889772 RepID=UPI000C14DE65|nr:DUF2061 domain-containing protein [Reichenbachiella sp. 5M10]PIB37124.1 hypothetical protein BFP72_17790 [Reichenbachiella sp. 5M10]
MDSRVRHIAKSITWRIIATGTTLLVAGYIQDEKEDALPTFSLLAFFDVTVKMLMYYLHERFWFNLKIEINSKLRHVIKAFSWRIIASLTTLVLVVILFRDQPNPVEKGITIAGIEFFLKMLFYYGHEEAWYRINLGLDNREKNKGTS